MAPKDKQKGFLLNPFRFTTRDPYFSKVKVLLPLSGSNNSVNFPDVKGNVWTSFGGSSILTNHWPEGAGNFSGSPMGLSTPYNPNLSFGSQDFCVEFDYFPTEDNHQGTAIVGQWGETQGTFGWLITNAWGSAPNYQLNVAMTPNGYYLGDRSTRHFFGSGNYSEVLLNTWSRIAVSRTNGVFYIFLNGVNLIITPMGYGNSADGSFSVFDPGLPLKIFPLASPGNSAQIKNLRITIGEGRYNTDYVTTTTPFPTS